MQVIMHKAADGALFEKFEDFAKHEASLKVKTALAETTFNLDSFHETDRGYKALDEESIPQFVADNADVLRKVLEGSKVVKRGRKSTKPFTA